MSNFGSQIQTAVHVRLATAAALPTCVYADASSVLPANTDLGAKLTASSAAALTIDGVAVVVDDEVLVKDQAATLQNGVYRVRVVGSTTVKWVLERSRLARDSGQFDGMIVTTGPEGSVNPSVIFIYSGGATPVIGTDAITYVSQGNANAAAVAALSADPQFFVPATTDTVAPAASGQNIAVFIDPAGLIAAMTLTLPNGSFKGQRISVNFTQVVTTLTVTATNTDTKGLAQPTAATATSTFEWAWDSVSSKWNRVR